MKTEQKYTGLEIAVTGMSCRFPGANNWRMFWHNLVNGVESIECEEEVADKEKNGDDAVLIKAKAVVKDKDLFDFSFFEYSPHEAKLLNPVHRTFHECVWEALEDAGYDPETTKGPIGLYAGASEDLNWKIYSTLRNNNEDVDDFMLHLINNKDYLASLISYKLNLKGPSVVVNTACSTSLVAISLACKSLLMGESRIALAGGITIVTKIQDGYLYKEGMIYSADGHCRAFDRNATGTVSSEGAGVVVLKRLTDAINDNDHIYAVIKGTALNNDGNRKVGYTAPGVEGQAACIRKAQLFAKVDPASITYVETHGTGTKLGDPIEIEALNIAFNKNTVHKCAIGSVKTNIGHSDAAAGVAGFIKTALSLKYRMLPPSLHFTEPNPEIDFQSGPFYVNTSLKEWSTADGVLRAGVSSFGIGGTNAHAILEEAPEAPVTDAGRECKLLTLSAKTQSSLLRYVDALKNFLQQQQDINLPDLSYTLQVGRKSFVYRLPLVYDNKEDLLEQLDAQRLERQVVKSVDRKDGIVFMFPGQGSQYMGMCTDLYEKEALFRDSMDKGFSLVQQLTGEELRSILYSSSAEDERIKETRYTQPILFLLEYSLAQLLMSAGIHPRYMIGHSIGEYVAACISGVFSFEEGVWLVIRRASLMNGLPGGSMLSAVMTVSEAQSYLQPGLSIAAVNGPRQVVFSGDDASTQQLTNRLQKTGIAHVKLQTSHAFHSSMLDDILDAFRAELEKIKFNKPVLPFISNLTGNFISDAEAVSPAYWVRHMRETVNFSGGIQKLLSAGKDQVFVEVGAGHTLTGLLKQHLQEKQVVSCMNLVRSSKEKIDDTKYLINRIGDLWSKGVKIDWQKYYAGEKRCRVSLPTYCFEPVHFPTEVDPLSGLSAGIGRMRTGRGTMKDWLYYPSWKRSIINVSRENTSGRQYLFLCIAGKLSKLIREALEKNGNTVIEVLPGESYGRVSPDCYTVDPAGADHFQQLLHDLHADGYSITDIIYAWGMCAEDSIALDTSNRELNLVYLSMVKLSQALLQQNIIKEKRFAMLTNCLYNVIGTEAMLPVQSLLLGLVNVLPQEYSVSCCNIDIDMKEAWNLLAENIAIELTENRGKEDRIVAYRHGHRWIQEYEKTAALMEKRVKPLKHDGVYLITGGLGNVGFILAKHLAVRYNAKLMLTGRTELENGSVSSSKQESLNRLRHLQSLCSEVKYFAADVCDESKLLKTVCEIESTVGNIDGVIHTAGIIDPAYFELIEDITPAKALHVLAPKIKGIENLYRIFCSRDPGFVWITSSIAGILGGLGYCAYSSANIYMDHFVSSRWKELLAWKCIDLAEMVFSDADGSAANAINADEIVQLFEWSQGVQHLPVIVETVEELPVRLRKTFYEKKEQYLDEEPRSTTTAPEDKPERPMLSTAYEEAQTETEKRLKTVFEDFFGIRMIGVNDSFFELGGDSLKAMILLKRIKKEFSVQLTLNEFFGRQTIKEIALYMDEIMLLLKEAKSPTGKTIVI